MALIVTPLYAGLLGLLLFALLAKVIKARLRSGVSIGDGSDAALAHEIRAQGNFVEYAPMGGGSTGLGRTARRAFRGVAPSGGGAVSRAGAPCLWPDTPK